MTSRFKAAWFTWLLLALVAGCRSTPQRHQTFKPVQRFELRLKLSSDDLGNPTLHGTGELSTGYSLTW